MTKRILIVSHYFYPHAAVGAKRMSELARCLCHEGHEVVVVSADSARYRTDPDLALDLPNLRRIGVPQPPKLTPAVLDQVKRMRARLLRARAGAATAAAVGAGASLANESLWQRCKRFYHSLEWLVDDNKLWAGLVAARLTSSAFGKPFDVVISSGPPMSAHLAVLLARPVLRGRWIMDLRDPWSDQDHWRPEIHSRLSRSVNRWLERRAVASADAIAVTTLGYAQVLRQRYPAKQDLIQLILNGFEGGVEASPPPHGRLDLLYAGSLYYNRDPFPLLRAILKLVSRPDVDRGRVSFRLFGHCGSWGGVRLPDWIAQHGLDDCVSVHPAVPAAAIRRLMAQSNVLVNFAQGQPMQIPAKMFEYIAARRDMLLLTEADSDSAWLGRQAGCAQIVPSGDQAAADAAVAALYDKYVRSPQRVDFDVSRLTRYSRETQNARFLDLLTGELVVEQEAGL